VTWKAPVPMKGKIVTWYSVGMYNSAGSMITACKAKGPKLACSLSIGNAKGSVRVDVYAAYGVGVLAGAKPITVKILN
jgi:hypothetical protein